MSVARTMARLFSASLVGGSFVGELRSLKGSSLRFRTTALQRNRRKFNREEDGEEVTPLATKALGQKRLKSETGTKEIVEKSCGG